MWIEPLELCGRLSAWDRAQRPDAWARTAASTDDQDMTRLILTLALTAPPIRDQLPPRKVPLGALLLTHWGAVGLGGQPISPAYRNLWRAFYDDTERVLRFAELHTHVNAIVLNHLAHTDHTSPPAAVTIEQRLHDLDTV